VLKIRPDVRYSAFKLAGYPSAGYSAKSVPVSGATHQKVHADLNPFILVKSILPA
jgi:hypothetical protein